MFSYVCWLNFLLLLYISFVLLFVMEEDDLVLIDECKSVQWNYVNRVERELELCNDYASIAVNPLLPQRGYGIP